MQLAVTSVNPTSSLCADFDLQGRQHIVQNRGSIHLCSARASLPDTRLLSEMVYLTPTGYSVYSIEDHTILRWRWLGCSRCGWWTGWCDVELVKNRVRVGRLRLVSFCRYFFQPKAGKRTVGFLCSRRWENWRCVKPSRPSLPWQWIAFCKHASRIIAWRRLR